MLGNEYLSSVFSGWTAEKITLKLGIANRPVAAPGETATDLAYHAGRRLLDSGICDPQSIDFVLLCTQSPDYFLPTSACILQERLGLSTRCGALDINLGCSGYVYSVAVAKGLIEAGLAKRVLLLTSETYSKYINELDRASRPLFGDGASASLIELDENASHSEQWLGPFEFGTDGRGADLLIVPAGGHRMSRSEETAKITPDGLGSFRSKNDLFMHGPGIFNFSINTIPPLVERMERLAQDKEIAIKTYIFHQANRYMLDRLRGLCGMSEERYYNKMTDCGNTVSSSIPIAMTDAWNEGFLKPEESCMLVGFGVGLSWGAALIRLPQHFRSIPMTKEV